MAETPNIRRSQAIRTFGPGSLIDLPRDAAIIGGLDFWPPPSKLQEVFEPRLSSRIGLLVGKLRPKLYLPPADDSAPWEKGPTVTAWRFPSWFVVDERDDESQDKRKALSRRLVHRRVLDPKRRFEGRSVVPTRFVQACPLGHVHDFPWHFFVHGAGSECTGRQMWLDEVGTGGDLGNMVVRCECKKARHMSEAMDREAKPLGTCKGHRPWLGKDAQEDCKRPAALLLRTASNAYFAQTMTVLSLPEVENQVRLAAEALLDHVDDPLAVASPDGIQGYRQFGTKELKKVLEPHTNEEVFEEFMQLKDPKGVTRPDRFAELDAIMEAELGFGEDVPPRGDFYARKLAASVWGRSGSWPEVSEVIQLHRLREVTAMLGFTRFEAPTQDPNGEVDTDVETAPIQREPSWYPAVENRGEGVFLALDAKKIDEWAKRPAVKVRERQLEAGFDLWKKQSTKRSKHEFISIRYILLHTLSHLLMDSISMTCGYPASSIRERIYCDVKGGRYGLLLYTGTPDADGTLGGLVAEGRNIEAHLSRALRAATLCSNDPICASHDSGESMEGRWLHGAACHGCTFIAETSCEMRNDHLDRALVVPTLGHEGAAFFAMPL